jgi:hypothetical protein
MLCNYNFASVGEEVEIVQLVKILKFLKNGDYTTRSSKIIDEEDRTKVNQLRWGEDLVCHNRLNGGDPKGFNGTSDEDSEEYEEKESNDYEDEVDEDFNINVDEIRTADEDNWTDHVSYYDLRLWFMQKKKQSGN